MKYPLVSALAISVSSVVARTITVRNACSYTIWPGLFTDPNVGAVPSQATGWEAPAGSSTSFTVPDNWKAGRIWGRTGCNFSSSPGPQSCVTGGCNGGLLCTSTGSGPATLAEFTFDGSGSDFTDVSLVDGFNLPVRITNTKGCPIAECPVDLLPNCPSALQGPFDGSGQIAGCKSACLANIDGTPEDSANCCTGTHSTPATCPPSAIAYYSYFKSACPRSYAYAYDESSGTSLITCPSSSQADYTVTFCP